MFERIWDWCCSAWFAAAYGAVLQTVEHSVHTDEVSLSINCANIVAVVLGLFVGLELSTQAQAAVPLSAAPRPMLKIEGDAQAGHATLSWSLQTPSSSPSFKLEESKSADFSGKTRVLYEGENRSSVISGLPDGKRFYRVRARAAQDAPWGKWSRIQAFDVKHYSLEFAFMLFASGAFVFACTLGFLYTMSSNNRG